MKANKAPKRKFVYPDKLYARCKDNKTLDISYAPQTLGAVEYTRTDAFIEKAATFLCECIEDCMARYMETWSPEMKEKTVDNFKNYMKGE